MKQLTRLFLIAIFILSLFACGGGGNNNVIPSADDSGEDAEDADDSGEDAEGADDSGEDAEDQDQQGADESSPLGKNESLSSNKRLKALKQVDHSVTTKAPQGVHYQMIDTQRYVVWTAVKNASYYNVYTAETNNLNDFHLSTTIDAQDRLEYKLNSAVAVYIKAVSYNIESKASTLVNVSSSLVSKEEDVIPF